MFMEFDHEVANLFSTFCSFITFPSFQIDTSSKYTYAYRYRYISVKRYCRGAFMFQNLKYILEFLEQLSLLKVHMSATKQLFCIKEPIIDIFVYFGFACLWFFLQHVMPLKADKANAALRQWLLAVVRKFIVKLKFILSLMLSFSLE